MTERILVIGMTPDCGGIENYILNTYDHLNKKKYQFDFLVKEDLGEYFSERIHKNSGRIYRVGTFKYDKKKVLNNLNSLYKNNKYKKIYINLSYAATLLYVIPALKYGVRQIFIHSHASDDIRKKVHIVTRFLFLKILSSKTDCYYLGCSKEACIWMYGKRRCEKNGFYIINNAIDFNKYKYNPDKRSNCRKEYNLDDSFVVGHVGRFSQEKNHKFIIEAFSELHAINKNTKLLLVGDGALLKDIQNLVKELKLENDIIFTGVVEDTSYFYNAMDCFWLPSIYEGLPISAVEAQTNGLKCLLSNKITTSADILKNGNCKFLDIENKEEFIKKTLNIKKDYSRLVDKKMIEDSGYDLDTEVKKLENLFAKDNLE